MFGMGSGNMVWMVMSLKVGDNFVVNAKEGNSEGPKF
jgi:hypothetical protein